MLKGACYIRGKKTIFWVATTWYSVDPIPTSGIQQQRKKVKNIIRTAIAFTLFATISGALLTVPSSSDAGSRTKNEAANKAAKYSCQILLDIAGAAAGYAACEAAVSAACGGAAAAAEAEGGPPASGAVGSMCGSTGSIACSIAAGTVTDKVAAKSKAMERCKDKFGKGICKAMTLGMGPC